MAGRIGAHVAGEAKESNYLENELSELRTQVETTRRRLEGLISGYALLLGLAAGAITAVLVHSSGWPRWLAFLAFPVYWAVRRLTEQHFQEGAFRPYKRQPDPPWRPSPPSANSG